MAQHPVPERLIESVVADLVSRIAEMGLERPEGADEAVSLFRALPFIGSQTAIEICWYDAVESAGADLSLDARRLTLAIADQDGSQEVYHCEANSSPRLDKSDFEPWIQYLKNLGAPDVEISIWSPFRGAARRVF